MTKELFFNRLRAMQVDSSKPMSDQLTSRLHQCSFLRRNHIAAKIEVSASRLKLIESLAQKLAQHYRALITFRLAVPAHCSFALSSFDTFIQEFFKSFGEPLPIKGEEDGNS
jgi:hypothetical protein